MLGGEGGGETEAGGATSIMAGIGLEDKASGGGASGSVGAGEVFEGDRSSGGNRWPRQETTALLKIRSDMDVVFRDSSLKGPLWEEVSRKMAELGYHRSAKKCKEKFENVYKYHKRTKEGRVGKSDGKTYRFFAELEALEQHQQLQRQHQHQHQLSLPPIPPRQEPVAADAVPVTMVMPAGSTVPSSPHPISLVHVNPHHHHHQQHQQQQQHVHINVPPAVQPMPAVHSSPIQMENSTPSSPEATASPSLSPSSSSTSCDGEMLGRGRKRKRKWNGFFEKLMKDVMEKQEELQKRFIEVVEKREHDRLARDEAWKMQEMARLNRERELLVQERSMAAAKDAALISFLQKLSDQQHVPFPLPDQTKTKIQTQIISQPSGASHLVPIGTTNQSNSSQSQPPPPQPQARVEENPVSVAQAPRPLNQVPPQQPPPQPVQQAVVVAPMNNIISTVSTTSVEVRKTNGNGDNHNMNFLTGASSSRWPKAEVEALINIRSNLDQKYQENGPKGPLWEEISTAMKKLGYNRNPKRCKEKWENINKYFKKVKESNKKRPEDSKTCPYFHQLDALYREKKQIETTASAAVTTTTTTDNSSYHQVVTPMTTQPQQQWPIQHHDNNDSENTEDDDMEDDDEDEHGNGYEIVSNNAGGSMGPTTSIATTTA